MCLKLKKTPYNCFFHNISLVFVFLINLDNWSPIKEAFDPFLHFDAAKECKKTYFAKDSVLMLSPK